jgi:hypothetical protein
MAMQSLIYGGKQAPIDFCGVDTPATPPNPLFHIGIFKATDFLVAVIDHIPPKGQQTVRYYGLCSNKSRGLTSPIPTRLVPPTVKQPSRLSGKTGVLAC